MLRFSLSLARLAFLLAVLVMPTLASAAADDDFLAARDAFRAGDARKLDLLARRLGNYVLEPYVAYWQLRLRLEDATPAEVRGFMTSYAETPLARNMLAEWLRQLGKNAQWEQFDAAFPRYTGDDLEITCYSVQSKLRTAPGDALAQARSLWFVPRELPDSCSPIFNALAQDSRLTQEDIWSRVRSGLEAGQIAVAQRAWQYLPAGNQPDYRTLTLISSNPSGYLDTSDFDLQTRAGRETVMFAAYRLARSAPSQAAAYWARLETRFTPEERGYVWGQIAYLGA